MKNLIVVINVCQNVETWHQKSNSIESIRLAAHRWKADFIELNQIKYEEENLNQIHTPGIWRPKIWQIFWIIENFVNYDRVLILDNDVIVNSKAPNIFDEIGDNDIAMVLDGNPGRLDNYILNNISSHFKDINDCTRYFCALPGFNKEKYLDNVYNTGVLLYKPVKLYNHIVNIKHIIKNGPLKKYINEHDSPVDQTLISAWLSTTNLKIKKLDNLWNWVCPDIWMEYEEYLTEMKPHIFHFCGTNLSKERVITYDKWK